jgi:hypothetical protein
MAIADFTNVNNQLQDEAGRFGQLISAKMIAADPWNRLVEQDWFPEGMGDTISTLLYERTTIPDVTSTAWSDVVVNDGTGNICVQDPQSIAFARTVRSYNLQQAAVKSPILCVEDIRYAYKFGQQLGEQYKILDMNSKWFWTNRFRDEFSRLAGHHIVTNTSNVYTFTESGSGSAFPSSAPTQSLDQGMLDVWYLDLARDAAEGAYATVDGQPQYALLTSPETSNFIKKQNADIRQDLRFSSHVDELIKPFGVGWSYSGFVHLIDHQAPRYNFSGGSFQRVPFYSQTAATTGNKSQVNPSYRTAAFEVSFIFNPKVFCSRVPKPLTSPGGNTSFPAQEYRGSFNWINNKDNEKNPTGKNGFFLAEFMQGSEPKRVEWGYAIMHLRCGPEVQYVNCS